MIDQLEGSACVKGGHSDNANLERDLGTRSGFEGDLVIAEGIPQGTKRYGNDHADKKRRRGGSHEREEGKKRRGEIAMNDEDGREELARREGRRRAGQGREGRERKNKKRARKG